MTAFTAALCVQLAALFVLASHGPAIYGMGTHRLHVASKVTPIYFRPNPVEEPKIAENVAAIPDPVTPAAPSKAQTADEAAPKDEPGSTSEDATDEGDHIVPFATWSLRSNNADGVIMFHHQFKNALPIFTPDPPILRSGKVPEPARGKDMVIEVVIDNQGTIVQAGIVKGVGYGMEEVVIETLRRWIYVPAKVNGVPIASRQQIHFHFPG